MASAEIGTCQLNTILYKALLAKKEKKYEYRIYDSRRFEKSTPYWK